MVSVKCPRSVAGGRLGHGLCEMLLLYCLFVSLNFVRLS